MISSIKMTVVTLKNVKKFSGKKRYKIFKLDVSYLSNIDLSPMNAYIETHIFI